MGGGVFPPPEYLKMGTVYLIHFGTRLHHAGHYLGYTSKGIKKRLAAHRSGNGSRLMEVIGKAGIEWTVARTWKGNRSLERSLKNQHNGPRLCPICKGEKLWTPSVPTTTAASAD